MDKQKEIVTVAQKYKDWLDFLINSGDINEELPKLDKIVDEIKERIESLEKNKCPTNELEPNDYETIVKLSENNAFIRPIPLDFKDKLKAAFIGRVCGCILGAPVEGWEIERMEDFARITGTPFPPTEYWHNVTNPDYLQYGASKRIDFILGNMTKAPADDDIMYPLLNMLLMEENGVDFSIDDVGKHWLKYMTVCFTAELEALNNLKKGIEATKVADFNPYVEWIGAAIRADLFGYVAPGNPLLAAKLAYRDAFLSHRRNGIYGEMYLAAVISAAFVCDTMKEALEEGLKVIPKNCALYKDLTWAIDKAPEIKGYKEARKAVDERFPNLIWVDTRNNLCLIVFALINAKSYDEAISEIVAMGLDNDCTGATVGSIYGALHGLSAIPRRWYECFNNKITCFLKDNTLFNVDNVVDRIEILAKKTLKV